MIDGPIEFPVEGLSDGVVRLRLLADADLEAVIDACQDPEIPRWTRVPAPYGDREARAWLSEQQRQRASGRGVHPLIVDAADDRLLGSTGIEINWEEGRGEVGYWVARQARGGGVASRAVRVLSGWAFDELRIDRIQICAEPENAASRRVAEQAGFTFEGVLRSYILNKGTRRDMAMYSLLRDESG